MDITNENHNQIVADLIKMGFSDRQAIKMLMALEPDENKSAFQLANEFYNGCQEIIRRMCHMRCPGNKGYTKQCDSCIVEHIFNQVHTHFKMRTEQAERDKSPQPAFEALAWLVLEAHKPDKLCW